MSHTSGGGNSYVRVLKLTVFYQLTSVNFLQQLDQKTKTRPNKKNERITYVKVFFQLCIDVVDLWSFAQLFP